MTIIASLREQYGAAVTSLSAALDKGDDVLFKQTLDDIVRLRENHLITELRRLTTGLQGALDRFRVDSHLAELVRKEVPDARLRLDHVLKLTDEAAHKTLDLVERSLPLADRTAREAAQLATLCATWLAQPTNNNARGLIERVDAFVQGARRDSETIRANLSETLVAQTYQDLTGQIIRSVMVLVKELEQTLSDLVLLSAEAGIHQVDPDSLSASEHQRIAKLRAQGPTVPGIDNGKTVAGQQDVDSLLSGLGF